MIDIQTYLEMLTWRRPHGTEDIFAQEFLAPLGVEKDNATGNWLLNIGNTDTIFTSHIDTVHSTMDIQKICYAPDIGVIYKDDNQPLGADDASGMFIMMNMIEEKVPGLYLFHIGEECGGIGSDDFTKSYEDILTPYNKVISFDRKGTEDIITHQAGGRCCSDEFAKALAKMLSCDDYTMKPCSGGLFTDSANYTHLVSECTNVAVGYDHEHTHAELQDTEYLMALVNKCVKVDWDSLPVKRDPDEPSTWQFGIDYEKLEYNELVALATLYPESAANIMYDMNVEISDITSEGIDLDELQ